MNTEEEPYKEVIKTLSSMTTIGQKTPQVYIQMILGSLGEEKLLGDLQRERFKIHYGDYQHGKL